MNHFIVNGSIDYDLTGLFHDELSEILCEQLVTHNIVHCIFSIFCATERPVIVIHSSQIGHQRADVCILFHHVVVDGGREPRSVIIFLTDPHPEVTGSNQWYVSSICSHNGQDKAVQVFSIQHLLYTDVTTDWINQKISIKICGSLKRTPRVISFNHITDAIGNDSVHSKICISCICLVDKGSSLIVFHDGGCSWCRKHWPVVVGV